MKILKLGQMIGGVNSPKPAGLLNEYSINFDGNNDEVKCGDSDDFTFGDGTTDSAFSLSAWINVSDLSKDRAIVTKANTGQYEYIFTVLQNQALRLTLFSNLSSSDIIQVNSASGAIPTGSWFHVACTYSGVGGVSGMALFKNGSDVTNTNNTNNYTAMANGTSEFIIGKNTPDRKVMSGNIDEVSIWDTKLNPSQITSLYNGGTPTDLTGMSNLIGWWRMGDPNGTAAFPTILDQSTNSNNATMTNMDAADIETVVP